MCGIFGYLKKNKHLLQSKDKLKLYESFDQLKHRGPDRSNFLEVNEFIQMYFGFHRLAIMDESINGDQPFIIKDNDRTIYCLCNGEIFNYKELIKHFDLDIQSTSDCEVIPLIYIKAGFTKLIDSLIGEFAFSIIEVNRLTKQVSGYICRDPFGIRPLFYGSDSECICFASELKGVLGSINNNSIIQFPPGNYLQLKIEYDELIDNIKTSYNFKTYYDYKYEINKIELSDDELFKSSYLNDTYKNIVDTLEECVISKLDSDRPIGALLSGGLDSSLIVGIAAKYLKEQGKRLKTFSIGLNGATDKKYADMVSEHCGTKHTHIEFKEEDFLNAIKNVVWATETFDITTIRASTGQYLISKWISENTKIKALLIGDGSDELTSGYMYFHNAPTPEAAHNENRRLLKDIHKYDVLRSDRGIAGNGMEARVPFLDYRFVDMYMNIDPRLRIPHEEVEKWLLRESFNQLRKELLPQEVLFRKKEAFSDGVSSTKKSWYEILQDHVNNTCSDDSFSKHITKYTHCVPTSKEALYYRELFNNMFRKDNDHIVPYYWLPKWCGNISEPSARVLDAYK